MQDREQDDNDSPETTMNGAYGGSRFAFDDKDTGSFGSSPTMMTNWEFIGSPRSNYFTGIWRQHGDNMIDIADCT